MIKDVECPYCGEWQEINHDDGYGYEEGTKHQQDCGDCGKTFAYETSISFYYEASKAKCLNGGKHNWKPENRYPHFLTRMHCKDCDELRKPTEEERTLHNIPKEYEP